MVRNKSGFTAIEIMIVVGIIAIVSAIAIPTMYAWLPNIHFRDTTQNLQSDVNLAKMIAMKRNATVYIRLSDTGTCPTSSSSFPSQESNYTISAENDDGSETTIRTISLSNDVTLCDCGDVSFSDEIVFLSTGLPDINSTVGACIVNSNLRQTELEVNLTGNVAMGN